MYWIVHGNISEGTLITQIVQLEESNIRIERNVHIVINDARKWSTKYKEVAA